jgi:hypothetical protein
MIRLAETREIAPYAWVHPDDDLDEAADQEPDSHFRQLDHGWQAAVALASSALASSASRSKAASLGLGEVRKPSATDAR